MDDNYQAQNQPQNPTQPSPQNVQPITRPLEPEIPTPNNQAPIASSQITEPVPQSDGLDDQIANMSNEEVIENFARGLLAEKNLGEMDEATEKDMINDLIERINEFINRAVLESLPKEKLDELDNMIENDAATPEAVAQLIQNSGIDAGAVSVEAMAKFREVYLGNDSEQEA